MLSILSQASPLSLPDNKAPSKSLRLFLSIPAKIEISLNPLSIGVEFISMLAKIVAKVKRGCTVSTWAALSLGIDEESVQFEAAIYARWSKVCSGDDLYYFPQRSCSGLGP